MSRRLAEELILGWAALHSLDRPPAGELNIAGLDEGPPGAALAVDDAGRGHLLLPADGPGPAQAERMGVRMADRRLEVSGGASDHFVDIVCEDFSLTEVFDQFVLAVAAAWRADEHPGEIASRVLADWEQFLAAGGKEVGADQLQPVFAELLVLVDAARWGDPCSAWRGVGARHDFVRADTAVEVKSTRAHTHHRVTVHGLDQLEPHEGGRLYIEFVRVEETVEGGRSVADLVDAVLEAGVPAPSMYAAIARAGIVPADLGRTREVRFNVLERRLFEVNENFPRLSTASMRNGTLPPGVDDVTYTADLSLVLDDALLADGTDDVHRSLAGLEVR